MGWRRLTGGLTSIVHRLTVERNGRREAYVLRWWVPDSEWAQWIARAVSYGPSWQQFLPVQIDGRAPLDVEGMTGRMEELLERALRRL